MMMIDDDLHFGFSGTSLVVLCSHRMAILIICIMFPTFALKPITVITITGENLIPSRKLLPRLRIVPRLLPRPCLIAWEAVSVPHLPCG